MLKKSFITLFLFLMMSNTSQACADVPLCQTLATHKADADVAHRPGAENVVPADLNPPLAAVPEVIRVPITIDLAQQLTQNLPPGAALEAQAGMVEIHADGRVFYNGQDLTARAQTLCRERGRH